MSTLLSCVCDSILAKLCEGGCLKINEIHEAGSNSVDASIASTICCSIVYVVLICTIGFLVWKIFDHIANGTAGLYKRHCEFEDLQHKQQAETKKQKLDLINKEIEILRELCYVTEFVDKDLKEHKKLKEHKNKEDEIGKYIDALESEINKIST